jgi:hypothetical protein
MSLSRMAKTLAGHSLPSIKATSPRTSAGDHASGREPSTIGALGHRLDEIEPRLGA